MLLNPVAAFVVKLRPGSHGVRPSCGPASAACARRRPANHASASAAWRMAFSRSCTAHGEPASPFPARPARDRRGWLHDH